MACATADDWKLLPLPELRAELGFEGRFTAAGAARLREGLVPEEMEDKWFIYLADDWLLFHRSWTGIGVFGLRLVPEGEGLRVAESWVSRDAEQYRGTDLGSDRQTLEWLLSRALGVEIVR